jgi:methionyl-tRNA formyltransferase
MVSGKTEQTVFFGTGPVAARCLELLLQHTAVEAVVTKPRPAHHRGAMPVLDIAEKYNLRVVTAHNKSSLDTAIQDADFTSRYAVLIDFGIIVSRHVIDSFPLGIVNSHFSLLPLLRGADPITWAIANGDEKTGVSLMLIDEGMDTGQLLTQKTLHLATDETTISLTQKLIILSDELIKEYVPRYLDGLLAPKNQPHPDRATYSRKLTKADGVIDWTQPAAVIEQRIRAFIDWPQSRTTLGDIEVIITKAHVSEHYETELSVHCGDDKFLTIDALKPLGKKEMPAKAFLAGYSSHLKV